MKLTDLKPGGTARLLQVPLKKMTDLGLTPGATVTLHGVGPFGDPLVIECNGCRLLIDRKTASETEAEPCD